MLIFLASILCYCLSNFSKILKDNNTKFETLVIPYLLENASLRLDWLHVEPLTKTMWPVEDELGLSRIITFMCRQFFLNMKLRETTNTSKHSLRAPATACVTACCGELPSILSALLRC